MSEQWKTDTELLQCSPWVDSTLFPKASNNRIAQDYVADTPGHLPTGWM